MAGRSPADAVHAYSEPLRRALSCLTDAVLIVSGYYPREEAHVAALAEGRYVPLPGASQLSLAIAQHYRIVETDDPERGPWKVHTAAYWYSLGDEQGQEVLAYHWHPDGRSRITWPHLHLGHLALGGGGPLTSRAHLPTGRVAVEQVLRLAIEELRVEPRRDDWQAVLTEAEAAFERWRTWP